MPNLATINLPPIASQSYERFFAGHSGSAMQAAPAALPGGAPRLMAPMSDGKSKEAGGSLWRVRFVVGGAGLWGEGKERG